jgi:CheY-like chemotaxis protein
MAGRAGGEHLMDALSILLVEDDVVDIMTVERALAKTGIELPLHIVRDGVEALEAFARGGLAPDRCCVLLDLNMPRMNGVELLRALRDDPVLCDARVVVLTTSNADRDRVETAGLAVFDYLVKPVTAPKLAELLARLA